MLTENGITIRTVDGHSYGNATRISSGDIALTVTRTDHRKKRRYLCSFFATASDGLTRYIQVFVDKSEAKLIVKAMRG